MKKIISYVVDYFVAVDKIFFLACAVFTGFAIFLNYHWGINHRINTLPVELQYGCWYLIFISTFFAGYLFYALSARKKIFNNKRFIVLLFWAPAIFSWKMVYDPHFNFSTDPILNEYWNRVIYWPFKLAVVTATLFITWKLSKEEQPLYGLTKNRFKATPYLVMLLIMVPLIAAASTQPDFLQTYPKLKNVSFLNHKNGKGIYKLLYELSYGSDFFTIELFFRGFLVLAFINWFGKNAILPMAMFYCTIHFGKPLGECISSFFGGLILGTVTYHTRSLYGGLLVHVGIAWLMELGGYLGSQG